MLIFATYTGNAMLNNALMTIEALAQLNSVSEITPEILKNLYRQKKLLQTNKRLKSYTMLFTKNGPLHNDKLLGEKHYDSLMNKLFDNFENEGDRICEISGLKFRKTFSEFNADALRSIGVGNKEIQKKDTNIGRTWFPLIGGLGSDAQALPQAKFGVQVHPICIAILQFLPLSAILYKGGVLLVDSSNFDLAKGIIKSNTLTLQERIESKSITEQIENIKDFSKGNFILKALNILEEKEDLHESFSDLNLWSFSNSGTGASCEIDRVPNAVLKKIQQLSNNSRISKELEGILSKGETSKSFLESLEGNKEWYLLYPNVFGSGKKSVKYEGVSPDFFEAYHKVIGKAAIVSVSKYMAGLIADYKSPYFAKILDKTDAWRDPEFKVELYRVLLRATTKGKWNLNRHIAVLDNNEDLPIKSTFYNLQKTVYYYTYKKIGDNYFPEINVSGKPVAEACRWIISLIEDDKRCSTIKSDITNAQEYHKVGYNKMFFSAMEKRTIHLEEIVTVLYNDNFYYQKIGLNELLRIYFSQPGEFLKDEEKFMLKTERDALFEEWKMRILDFVTDYNNYYFFRYQNPQTGQFPIGKFRTTVDGIVNETDNFSALLKEMIFNTNEFLRKSLFIKDDKWLYEDIMTDPLGNKNWNICTFTVKFLLKQAAIQSPVV